MEKRKKTDTVQLKLRLREELRARLAKAAKAEKVSLNTEIILRLEASFDSQTIKDIEQMGKQLRATLEELARIAQRQVELEERAKKQG